MSSHPEAEYYEKLFKTNSAISLRNMVGFNHKKKLHRYEDAKEILEEFFEVRMKFYLLRKEYLCSRLEREL